LLLEVGDDLKLLGVGHGVESPWGSR
jgi:hypothetical protein